MALTLTGAGNAVDASVTVPITSVYADGWRLAYPGVGGPSPTITLAPNTSPVLIPITRQGFDSTGAATTYSRNIIPTTAIRQPYPNPTLTETDQAAADDYIYAGDVVPGVTNSSTLTSPKPVGNWAMFDNQLVGATLPTLQVIARHRDAQLGKQVAAVKFRITGNVAGVATTVYTTTSTPVTLSGGYDIQPVEGYEYATPDISAFDDGAITVNAQLYPWYGDPINSIADSGSSSVAREFSPRTFLKQTTRAAARPVCYVSNTSYTGAFGTVPVGDDTATSGGIWSTTPSAAAARPFLTIKGALDQINNATNGAAAASSSTFALALGDAAGVEIRIGQGTFTVGATLLAKTNSGAMFTVTRDPAVAKASAIISFTAAMTTKAGDVRFYDLTMVRNNALQLVSTVRSYYEKVDIDNNSQTATILHNAAGVGGHWLGVTITNCTGGSVFTSLSLGEHRLVRGMTALDMVTLEGWLVLGSRLGASAGTSFTMVTANRNASGAIVTGNILRGISSTLGIGCGQNEDINGWVFDLNVAEVTHTTSGTRFMGITPDSGTGNVSHVLCRNNTVTGAGSAGRWNVCYDWAPSANVERTSVLCSFKNLAIGAQWNIKGDWFGAYTGGLGLGNRAVTNGVGCRSNVTLFRTNSGGSEQQHFPGIGSLIGTDPANAQFTLSAVWTTYRGTTCVAGSYTAGAGGGTYTTVSGSPLRLIGQQLFAIDLSGTARTSTDTVGAYV